jgi:biopolymer transport protein ExbB/TolQ
LSFVTLGILTAYLIARARPELVPGESPWRTYLEPLAGFAVMLGMLGSVTGIISAFATFEGGLDLDRMSGGLAEAYWTTGVGLCTALVASIGAYILDVLNR